VLKGEIKASATKILKKDICVFKPQPKVNYRPKGENSPKRRKIGQSGHTVCINAFRDKFDTFQRAK
jgi:hypothetical protein